MQNIEGILFYNAIVNIPWSNEIKRSRIRSVEVPYHLDFAGQNPRSRQYHAHVKETLGHGKLYSGRQTEIQGLPLVGWVFWGFL